jgi:hypothetical protein
MRVGRAFTDLNTDLQPPWMHAVEGADCEAVAIGRIGISSVGSAGT